MRVLLQRVSAAKVETGKGTIGSIGTGLLVFLAIAREDSKQDADYLLNKIIELRVFPDVEGKMNRSLVDVSGALLIVSQFTLYGDCRKGRRPSFDQAASPEQARTIYDYFVAAARARDVSVQTGEFQASMQVSLINEGPVTIWMDSGEMRSGPVTSKN